MVKVVLGHWSGWPFPPPGDLPNLGVEIRSPMLQADSLPAEPQGSPQMTQEYQALHKPARGSLLKEYSNQTSSMGFQGVYTLSIILLNILPKDTRKIHNIQELNISESLGLSCDGYSILTHMVSNFFSLVLSGHSPWKQGTRVKKRYST